jgi:hypothetical protein
MAAKKSLARKIVIVNYFLVPILPPLLVFLYFILMFGDKADWIVNLFCAIAPFFLFLFFFLVPYLRSKIFLSRMGYTCTMKGAFLFFYSGRAFKTFPAYEDVSHHQEFASNDVSCLISYLERLEHTDSMEAAGDKEANIKSLFYKTLRRHPKRRVAYLIYMMEAFLIIGIPCITFAMNIFLQGKVSDIPWLIPILIFAPLMGVFIVPDLISRKELARMGYSKTFQANAWVFFYTGSYFLPLPHHEEIATLPDFREDDIYSLIEIQIQMFKAKKIK